MATTAQETTLAVSASSMNELSQTIQEVPLAGLVPVILLIIVGLLMWTAGRKLLRPGFAAAGLLLGGAAGWLVGENINLGIPGWLVAIIVGIVVAAVASLAYRLAVASALAVVLGVASPMAVISINEMQGAILREQPTDTELPEEPAVPENERPDWLPDLPDYPNGEDESEAVQERIDEIERWLHERIRDQMPGMPLQRDSITPNQFTFNDEVAEHLEHVKNFAEAIASGIAEVWNQTPESLRPILVAATILGGLLGLLVGALIPVFSASVVTAFGGSLLWLFGVRILSERLADGAMMPSSVRAWLVLWIIVSVIGLCIQWMFRPKQADKRQR